MQQNFHRLDFIAQQREENLDRINERSERSLYDYGILTTGTAGQVLANIDGFQSWQQSDVYRLDYMVVYSTIGTNGNVELRIGGIKYRLPVSSVAGAVCQGSFFVSPNNMDISLNMVADDAAGKIVQGSLTMTRMPQGFRYS